MPIEVEPEATLIQLQMAHVVLCAGKLTNDLLYIYPVILLPFTIAAITHSHVISSTNIVMVRVVKAGATLAS